MVQHLVVALAVLAAALYSAWALAPARARLAALSRLDAALGPGWLREHLVAPLRQRAAPQGGCGGCGGSTPTASVAAANRAGPRARRP